MISNAAWCGTLAIALLSCNGAALAIDPGRSDDARVATIAYRLGTAGLPSCPRAQPALGLLLQHLGQFRLADRPEIAAAYHLNRGPGVVAVVPNSPAAVAGVQVGDLLMHIDGIASPNENGLTQEFDQTQAQAFSDEIDDRIEAAAAGGVVSLDLLRDDRPITVRVAPLPACPSRVHLARSSQRNAFADGVHVFVTTEVVGMTRTDDELAFVLAHEMAHNILQHAAEMRGAGVHRGLLRNLGRSGRIVSRTEREADLLGADLVEAAGYDSVRGADVLHLVDSGPFAISLFAAHDSVSKRIAAIKAHLAARPQRLSRTEAAPSSLSVRGQ